jgi:translation initiation factor IF-3
MDLDLVEVAPQASPPVCRIMDYNKFKFDEAQRARESRRKSTNASLKEMKYRLKIGPGDFETKTRKVSAFLAEGHKVKITIMFRGREVERPQFGQDILNRIADTVSPVGKVESMPRLDGRNMVMVLAPDKRAQAAHGPKGQGAEPEAAATAPSRPPARPQPTPGTPRPPAGSAGTATPSPQTSPAADATSAAPPPQLAATPQSPNGRQPSSPGQAAPAAEQPRST